MRFSAMATFECLRMFTQMSVHGWTGRIFKGTILFGTFHDHPDVLDGVKHELGRLDRQASL